MKHSLYCMILYTMMGMNTAYAGSVESYIHMLEQANQRYQQSSRQFFNTLNPQQQGFNAAQQAQYCRLLQSYVNDVYAAVLANQNVLKQKKYNKADVIAEIEGKREIQALKKYAVKCQLE